MAEKITEGLVENKFAVIPGYPASRNTKTNGITYFVGKTYENDSDYKWLKERFSKATKKQTLENSGEPDLMVVKDGSDVIVVVECKPTTRKHSSKEEVADYANGGGMATPRKRKVMRLMERYGMPSS